MVGLENRLSDLLGVHVDLSSAHVLKEPVRAKAAREAVLAFQGAQPFAARHLRGD
jgi:predicted nucleotidyltransferase